MEQLMMETIIIISDKAKEKWNIVSLVWYMKVSGEKIYLKEKEHWRQLIWDSNTKVSLCKETVQVKEFSLERVQFMKDNVKTIL